MAIRSDLARVRDVSRETSRPVESPPAVLARNVSRHFRRGFFLRATPVLRRIDLRVEAGEGYALLGANGSGKSTTLRILAGLLEASSGDAAVFGARPGSASVRRRVSFLPETEEPPGFLRPAESLELFASLWGIPRAERAIRCGEALERVGIADARRTRVRHLSKGQLRRLAIARALVPRADLLLLDEPGEGLDAAGLADLGDLLRGERARGAAILLAAHLRDEVDGICDRAGVLQDGCFFEEGPAAPTFDRMVAAARHGRR
jgi:ABC-2 type transport system ATP-binding protein